MLSVFVGFPTGAQLMQVDPQEMKLPEGSKQPGATPCMVWMEPEGPTKGILVCVHGLGLHKGCYRQFAERMTKLGWGIYAVDVRGFGSFMTMPKGARHVDFEGCMGDVREAIELVRQTHPGMPVYLVGESMGGGIAFQAASRYADMVNGVISACPASKRQKSMSAAVRVGANLLTGKHHMDIKPILVNQSTQKEELRQTWLHDPLGRFEMDPMELIHFQLFMDGNYHAAKKMTKTPVIILQGQDDKLVNGKSQEGLIKDIPHQDKMLVYVEHSEHLILEEGQFNDAVIATVSEWLDAHLPEKTAAAR